MTKKEPVAPAFGAFLCKLQSEQLVNGRRLTNATIAQETMMRGLSPGAVRFQNSRPAKTPDRLCGLVES